jgi:hypothetical protein
MYLATAQQAAPVSPVRLWLALFIFALWIALVLSVFWQYQLKFQNQWFTFAGADLAGQQVRLIPGKMSVVHFVDPDCPCSRFSAPHIETLEANADRSRVAFAAVNRRHASGMALLQADQVPASPAVAVWDTEGELVYFGPYSTGALCGQGEDILARVIANVHVGNWQNQEAVGCLCPWRVGVS